MNKLANMEISRDVKSNYALLKERHPGIRARNAAEMLGVSEGELVASRTGEDVLRLVDDAESILRAVLPLGEVMALTRNQSCVHESKGIYDNCEFSRHGKMAMGLFVNKNIDLRLFMHHWKFCFAVTEQTRIGPRNSLQFFDREGVAIHKIYLTGKSNASEFKMLVDKHRHKHQDSFIEIEPYEPKAADRKDSEIDWPAFRTAWSNLRHTHDFHTMLRKFKVGREQAFGNIGRDYAFEVCNNAARLVLEMARDANCEIMIFVGNRGCIQIHTGTVSNLAQHGEWFNVLDPMFNLHLSEDRITRSWISKKPTEDGIVTALEIFDKDGEIIATFFGKRKPGIPELKLWRRIIADIPMKQVDM